MASNQILFVLMLISILAVLGLTFILIRSNRIVYKYKKESEPIDTPAPVYINEHFDPTTKTPLKCNDNDINKPIVACALHGHSCINGECVPNCLDVKYDNNGNTVSVNCDNTEFVNDSPPTRSYSNDIPLFTYPTTSTTTYNSNDESNGHDGSYGSYGYPM